MKTLYLLIVFAISGPLFAQSIQQKEIKSAVNEVTVFIEGAQITRRKTVELNVGTTLLKFNNLSPFIDAKSVRVKASGSVTVLSVNHQQNYIDKLDKPQEIKNLETKIEDVNTKLHLQETYLSILNDELSFLNENRSIGGKYKELSVTNLKEATEYYSSKLTSIKLNSIEKKKAIEDLIRQKKDLENQLKSLSSKREFPAGEVWVKVETKSKTYPNFELSYVVKNAGWFPSYDIRAKSIKEPVEITYKANLRQDTKVDWNNVKLSFSSSNPNISGIAPVLKPYYLGYGIKPPEYSKVNNFVSGQVFDENKMPMIGATVLVSGTSIGTVTDANGHYSITLPPTATALSFSYIGYVSSNLPITESVMNVFLQEDNITLDEFAIVGHKSNVAMGSLQGRMAGVEVANRSQREKEREENIPIPFQKNENQTSIEFDIEIPYTVKSDNKNYTVDMTLYEVPAFYQYFCIPKIEKDAFLIANITNWEAYNLLEGEANIFFEETFIGKTLLDVRFASDTLQLSLGRDKNVSVNREKIKDHTTRQFIGTKKEETRAWKTIVKNNKSHSINMIVLDQIPVSKLEEIEIELQELSKGKHNPENGEIKWEFTLEPTKTKELELKYSVKYPKSRTLTIE